MEVISEAGGLGAKPPRSYTKIMPIMQDLEHNLIK